MATADEKFNVGGVLLDQPFKIRRLGHFGFNLVNMEDGLRFYTDLLGFRISDITDYSSRAADPKQMVGLGDPNGYFAGALPAPGSGTSRPQSRLEMCRAEPSARELPATARQGVKRALYAIGIALTLSLASSASANPYLARRGEPSVPVRVGTCAITGGFIHLYSAVANGLFDKYGMKIEHVTLRGGVVSLAALGADEVQFVYCSADPMIPRMAAGADAKLVGSALVGLPWVLMGRKEIKRPVDLKGKSIAVSRPGGLTDQLAKAVLKKHNLTTQDVRLVHIGGTGQLESYNMMLQGITQAVLLTPPLDVRARRDGFSLIYNLNDLGLPAIYSSVFTNAKSLKERPQLVQRFVAAIAESIHFVEKNPDKGKDALAKYLNLSDDEVLQSAYDAYAKALVNRRMAVPANAVTEAVEAARAEGTQLRRSAAEIFDNTFALQLEKSGFLKELWGGDPPFHRYWKHGE